jgi:hypothetical protein
MISTNSATTTGTFLDPNRNIQINHSVLDERIFDGDTQNISGADIFAPPPPRTPEPASPDSARHGARRHGSCVSPASAGRLTTVIRFRRTKGPT